MKNSKSIENLIYQLNNQLINNVLTFNIKIKRLIPNPNEHRKFLLNLPSEDIIIPSDIKIQQEMVKILQEDINTVNNQLDNLHSVQNIKINQTVDSKQLQHSKGIKRLTNKSTQHIGFLNRSIFAKKIRN